MTQQEQNRSDCNVYTIALLQATLRAAQGRYINIKAYSEGDFEVFRPAGATRCTDGSEIWRGEWTDLLSTPT